VLADPLLAEEAAQEAALQAMLALDRLRQPARFGAWLGGIGLNICRRWRRRRALADWSWEEWYGGWHRPEPVDWQADPAELAEAADLRAAVQRAVAALPPGQRAAVLLFYFDGLTQAETAVLLGVEVGAVKTRLHKARRTLRRSLSDLWKEPTMAETTTTQPVAVRVADVRRQLATGDDTVHSVIVLEEIGGERRMPIWVGMPEADGIALFLARVQTPRPLWPALAASLLQAAGGRLREVRISRLVETVFYAVAVVEGPGGSVEIDARPSDALALALNVGAPIAVEPAVFAASDASRAQAADVAIFPERWYGESTQGAADIAVATMGRWHHPHDPPQKP
jgi:RNA polymerase sigma factor (sigma-70 family)